ncbi:TetR family transcriptional regulator [Actinoplanes cyaneus]|uniref:TetR family transcriptional regulator n=1 Tax=Actinoplanes cyaneus TaxID=52696 RepID=A0A919M1T4_9ACTN|nr:TetR/AcrR family transcriptional regulator [Actinoplanes cyaneus]MCW2135882.1 transcriptional regulator, TetR family [Actinoplanes cyaneus]GID62752.1 TetR family transcriptional regulator [Actinoplanes cyaneus]
MADTTTAPSARRTELLELAYAYVRRNGLTELSLRPLAAEIGSSPRVLLFLFGSKDGLVRALLARAREEEIALLRRLREGTPAPSGLPAAGEHVWTWLSDPAHRPLLILWLEAYARSLLDPGGPWANFAATTVTDWLDVLATAQPESERDTPEGLTRRTALLAVLRGALIDLLATGDEARTTAAVRRHLHG